MRPVLRLPRYGDSLIFVQSSGGRFVRAGLLVCALGCPQACQHPQSANLAVELSHRYIVVPERGVTSTEISGDSLRPLAGGANNNQQFVVKLDFTIAGDSLTTTVYAIPPESDPLRYADGHKRRLGVHSARLNQSFELTELTQMGYQPVPVKIISTKPAVTVHPTVVSKVPSIQVDLVDEDVQGCTLLLRNVSSSRAVLAYALTQGSHFSIEVRSNRDRPAIAQGATRKHMVGFMEEPASRDIAIVAAIFNDGSHEGEDRFAAKLKAEEIGDETQYGRMRPIIDRIVQNAALDDDSRTAQIREQLHNLSDQAEEPTMRALASQFPNLPREGLATDLTEGLDSARRNLWSSLYGYVHSSATYPPPHPPPLAEWWRRYRESH